MSEKLLVSVDEAGTLLGVSRSVAYTLSRSEGFPTIRVGRRVLIPLEQLKEWIARQAQEGKEDNAQ